MSDKVPISHKIVELANQIKDLSEQLVIKVSQNKEVSTNESRSTNKRKNKSN